VPPERESVESPKLPAPPQKSSVLLRVLMGVLIAALVMMGVFTFVVIAARESARRSQAKTMVVNLTAALKAYDVEYSKWPSGIEDGAIFDAARTGKLMDTLRGKNPAENPRKIVFFEGPDGVATESYRGGLSPEGVLYDPWGRFYQIAVDTDGDEKIPSPYGEDDEPIAARVIVWSLGKDGKLGAPDNPYTRVGSDDVTSW
jgi:hypothetical protein